MANSIVPFEHQLTLADSIAKSMMFGIRTRDQALVLMALCEAEGLHPIVACRDFNIIQGRPALKADAMLTRFQSAGGKVRWISYTDENVTGEFSHAQGGTITVDWTMDRAKKAGLAGKGPWLTYPRAMLRARVVSEAIRSVFPGVLSGFYTPEEVQDFDEPRKPPRDITPPKPRRSQADQLADLAGDPSAVRAAAPGDGAESAGTAAGQEPAADAQAPYDADTGEVREFFVAVEVKDGASDWAGWCATMRDMFNGAKSEGELEQIKRENGAALETLGKGGKGGLKAADQLASVYNARLIALRQQGA